MKRAFLVVAVGLLAIDARPLPAAALDCAKAERPVEKVLCSTPELRQADDAVSAAYFKLLHETKDPDFHAALIRSQQRWLEQRSLGPQGNGQASDDEMDDRASLLGWTRVRLDDLRSGTLIQTMEGQRKLVSKESGGPFAGYDAGCGFWHSPSGYWSYVCWNTMYRQHHDRICSVAQAWASGHYTDYRLVSVVKNGKPRTVAGCSIGYAMTKEPCPDSLPIGEPVAHWATSPDPHLGYAPPPVPGKLWKYDPDIAAWQYNAQPWMDECLFAPVFPPPEQSRP